MQSRPISLYHAFAYLPPGDPKSPIVPVVYDASFVRHPETHPPGRIRMLAALGEQLRRAAFVHTISNFSAAEIAEIYRIDISRIAIIHPGVNPIFWTPPRPVPGHYRITPDHYFVVASTLEPRKNLRTLVIAYSRLSRDERMQFPLLVAGAAGWGALDLPQERIALEQEGSLRFLGYTPLCDLHSLYTKARATFYPSIYEGFGMPVIEALACGAPVVCSDSPSLDEAAGVVARRVPSRDIEGWTQELRLAIEQTTDRTGEILRRRTHAQQFSWEQAAARTIELYKRIVR
jgi:alpha-1,3-rhamnosyl/mannosyltransferase